MTDDTTPHLLQTIQGTLAALVQKVDANTSQIAVLANAVLTIRQEVRAVDTTLQTIAISTAGHGQRLANVEDGLDELRQDLARIEKRLPQ